MSMLLLAGACESYSLGVPRAVQITRSTMPVMGTHESFDAFRFGAGGGDGVKGTKTVCSRAPELNANGALKVPKGV